MARNPSRAGYALVAAALLALAGVHCARTRSPAGVEPASRALRYPEKKPDPEPGLRFSHRLHAEMGMGCADCHGEGSAVAVPGERSSPGCGDCHEIGDRKQPSEDCAYCHRREDLSVSWPQSPRLAGLVFDHGRHQEGECAACHPGKDAQEKPPSVSPGRMEACTGCHDRSKPLACAGCHDDLDTLEPRTHAALNWKTGHGPFARSAQNLAGSRDDCAGCHGKQPCRDCHASSRPASHTPAFAAGGHGPEGRKNRGRCETCHGSDACRRCHAERKPRSHRGPWPGRTHGTAARADEERCGLCHAAAFCHACHADRPPGDHTRHFRQVGHGFAVTADRDRCRACHRVDFCVRCHGQVSPRSHTLGWNNPSNRHCLSCHWPPGSGRGTCTVCHRSFPGHAAQSPVPASHAGYGSNCSACHGSVHPDNGQSCRTCHP